MYRKVEDTPSQPEDFEFPLLGKLSHDNRWVVMASLVSWTEFEEEYALNFAEDIGSPALPFRMALGALIIKEKLGVSDRETVEQIKENPYNPRVVFVQLIQQALISHEYFHQAWLHLLSLHQSN